MTSIQTFLLMETHTALMLLGAGVVGGTMSALAGGASLVLFPAMLAAGVPPLMAVASNSTGMILGTFLAAMVDRSRLPKVNRSFIILLTVSLVASTGGAMLLILTPERVFELLVPPLLGLGTVLVAYAQPIGNWLGQLSFGKSKTTLHPNAIGLVMMVPISIYAGYFGAGVGVLMLAALTVANSGDYRSANVTKNLLNSLSCLVAAIVFGIHGIVAWVPTLLVGTGAIAGSLAGAYVARILPAAAARMMVVAFGALLTAVYTWRYWF
jgi:uncharacterized membrane protein YfcA